METFATKKMTVYARGDCVVACNTRNKNIVEQRYTELSKYAKNLDKKEKLELIESLLLNEFAEGTENVIARKLIARKRREQEYRATNKKSDLYELFKEYYFANKTLPKESFYEGAYIELRPYSKMSETGLRTYIEVRYRACKAVDYARFRRLKRKAQLNTWNYFITITNDGRHTDTDFRKRVSKFLSNAHSRYKWRYIGVWENGEKNGRLHFHAIIYVPPGKMKGKLVKVTRYSTKRHRWEDRIENTYFAERFGINEFEEINEIALRSGAPLRYMAKYLDKTLERIKYSRGTPTTVRMNVSPDDVAFSMFNFCQKLYLYHDVLEDRIDDPEVFRQKNPNIELVV